MFHGVVIVGDQDRRLLGRTGFVQARRSRHARMWNNSSSSTAMVVANNRVLGTKGRMVRVCRSMARSNGAGSFCRR